MFGRQRYADLRLRIAELEVTVKALGKEWQGAEAKFNALYARLARKARQAARDAEKSLDDAPEETNDTPPRGRPPLVTNPAALALLRGGNGLLPR